MYIILKLPINGIKYCLGLHIIYFPIVNSVCAFLTGLYIFDFPFYPSIIVVIITRNMSQFIHLLVGSRNKLYQYVTKGSNTIQLVTEHGCTRVPLVTKLEIIPGAIGWKIWAPPRLKTSARPQTTTIPLILIDEIKYIPGY